MASKNASITKRLSASVAFRSARFRKYLWQRSHCNRSQGKTVVFIVGCHRSGTTMLGKIMDRSPQSWVYLEDNRKAMKGLRLRPPTTIKRLVRKSCATALVFKPICDTQWTDRILADHPSAKAIWIFRRYQDVANSAVAKWRGHQKEIMRWIRDGDDKRLQWRGERIMEDTRSLVSDLYKDDMTHEDGATLFWYLRNKLFFDLKLDNDPRVLMVRYEDLVQDPSYQFRQIFEFADCPFRPELVKAVFASSVQRQTFPAVDPDIGSLCNALTDQLGRAYDAQNATRCRKSSPAGTESSGVTAT